METKRIEQIYDEIVKYTINLELDPTVLGPRYLQQSIATCRNYMNAVSAIMGEIHREKSGLERNLRAQEAAFKISSDELLASDARVMRLPNIADRQATINMILSEQVRTIEDLKRDILNLEHVEKAVRHRHNELKATSSDIRSQRQLLRDEIDSGSYYGDEVDGDSRKRVPVGTPLGRGVNVGSAFDEKEIDRLMAEAEGIVDVKTETPVVHSEKPEVPQTFLALVPESDDGAMNRFLAGVPASHTGAAKATEEDYAALLAEV